MPIDAIAGQAFTAAVSPGAVPAADPGSAFTDSLGRMLDATNVSDQTANKAVGQMLDGTGDVHEAMIALQQADVSFQLMMQIRNKLVTAYEEIQRMQI